MLMVHLIFVCKYRRNLLTTLGEEVKSCFTIIEMEVDVDQVHILLSYEPKFSVLEVVRLLKQFFPIVCGRNILNFFLSTFGEKKHFVVMVILLVLLEME